MKQLLRVALIGVALGPSACASSLRSEPLSSAVPEDAELLSTSGPLPKTQPRDGCLPAVSQSVKPREEGMAWIYSGPAWNEMERRPIDPYETWARWQAQHTPMLGDQDPDVPWWARSEYDVPLGQCR